MFPIDEVVEIPEKYKEYKKEFSKLSAMDNEKIGFVNLNQKAYDFDEIVKDIEYKSGTKFKSSDCFVLKKDKIIFIEFKNRKVTGDKQLKQATQLKAFDSIVAFGEKILNNDFVKLMGINKEFYVVYNSARNEGLKNTSTDIRTRERLEFISDTRIYLDLEKYNGNIFSKVDTIKESVFKELVNEGII